MLALKAKMPSFNKNKKKRSEKIKAEKREKKSLQAVPPAVPEGCVHPMSKYSRLLGGYLVYGCGCPVTRVTCCSNKLPAATREPLRSCTGYTSIAGRCPHNVLENAKFYRRTMGLELRARVGVCGFADRNGRDMHVVYGAFILMGNQWRDCESFHVWLEDSKGFIYDHVDLQTIELGDICGADTSRVQKYQRFVGLSREDIFAKYGVWYESHDAGSTTQAKLNSEIDMGFTQAWPLGCLPVVLLARCVCHACAQALRETRR